MNVCECVHPHKILTYLKALPTTDGNVDWRNTNRKDKKFLFFTPSTKKSDVPSLFLVNNHYKWCSQNYTWPGMEILVLTTGTRLEPAISSFGFWVQAFLRVQARTWLEPGAICDP
jgi:hypothetical protein